jgi:probable DNA repair protein
MGQEPEAEQGSAAEIDGWLRNGGLVVTASDRAARALAAAFHRARRAEGLLAWPAPGILDWKSFVRAAWEERGRNGEADGRLVLNPTQEQSLWAEIAGADGRLATLLEGPRHRLAALAMEAHELLCSYAPQFLRSSARAAWQQDAAAFSGWLAAFDRTCREGNSISTSRLALELIPLLGDTPGAEARDDSLGFMRGLKPPPPFDSSSSAACPAARPPLLLAGFDRILPTQRAFFDAWGAWRLAAPGAMAPGELGKPGGLDEQTEPAKPPAQVFFHQAADAQAELAACALWCRNQLAVNPRARLLVVTQSVGSQPSRGQIERAFLQLTGPGSPPLFEFSLGVPLSQVAHARAALLLLRWLSGSLAEHELDWLFSTGQAAASPQEASALQARMRALRRRGLERPEWALNAFIQQRSGPDPLPASWLNRIAEAQRRLADIARQPQSPLDWAELVPRLLETAGWPGPRPPSSAEFQALRRFQQAVEAAGSLGFDGRRILWADFLSILARVLDETLFAPESQDAPIQIAGPAESAGLTADGVWFLGVSEDAWPAGGATHPLLPPEVQRQAGMPHASPQLDWELAQAITARLLASAAEVHFSYARQTEGIEARPSRLIVRLAGAPRELHQALPRRQPLAVPCEDSSRIPFPLGRVQGGAEVLTFQSQCPFKAFATARLGAQCWKPAEAGLTPSQRGQLLHAVLHAVWGGPPDGIRSQRELQDLAERSSFVAAHVRRIFQGEMISALRQRMPRRYLELEEQRLTGLVTEWLDYESARIGFEVAATEVDRTIHLAGLTLDLRLDRIDRLIDGSLLVIDYKTGGVAPKSWELPRPDDVQLPLYAGFALDGELGGLVFAKVRAGDLAFAGHVGDPAATLFPGLKGSSALVKNALAPEQLPGWRQRIEQLARDFLAGRSEVDPREASKTCERCGLQTLCRVQENEDQVQLEDKDDSVSTEAADD